MLAHSQRSSKMDKNETKTSWDCVQNQTEDYLEMRPWIHQLNPWLYKIQQKEKKKVHGIGYIVFQYSHIKYSNQTFMLMCPNVLVRLFVGKPTFWFRFFCSLHLCEWAQILPNTVHRSWTECFLRVHNSIKRIVELDIGQVHV